MHLRLIHPPFFSLLEQCQNHILPFSGFCYIFFQNMHLHFILPPFFSEAGSCWETQDRLIPTDLCYYLYYSNSLCKCIYDTM